MHQGRPTSPGFQGEPSRLEGCWCLLSIARGLGFPPACTLAPGSVFPCGFSPSPHPLFSLLQDEPSSGMDPCSKRHLWEALRKEAEEGCAVVLSSHR